MYENRIRGQDYTIQDHGILHLSNNSGSQPQTARLRIRASKIGVHVNIPFPRRIVELEFRSPFLVVENAEDGGEDEVEFLVGEIDPVVRGGALDIMF